MMMHHSDKYKYSRYYLHRMIRKNNLQVSGKKKQVDIPANIKLDNKQRKYVSAILKKYHYNIQSVIH